MTDEQSNQIQFEIEPWKRILYHLMDENTHLKNRLGEVLKIKFDKKYLEKAEQFQGHFIKFDTQIMILRNQLADVHTMVVQKMNAPDETKKIIHSLKIRRKGTELTQKEFNKLRQEFICFLVKIFNTDSVLEDEVIRADTLQ
ncbi:MAG: hypothetical protein WBB31_19230 [Saprospiraceae bacterium]